MNAVAQDVASKPKQVRKRPDVRSAEIVDAAAKVFIRDGYPHFNLRAVAAEVGIRLGSLQHHFPSREALLATTLEQVTAGWNEQFRKIADRKDLSVLERLKQILQHNLDLILQEPAAPLLWELFALAQHEEFALKVAQNAYLTYRRIFTGLLAEVCPDLGDSMLMAHATLITSQTEGLMVFMRPDDPAKLSPEAVREALDMFAEGFIEKLSRQASSGKPSPARR